METRGLDGLTAEGLQESRRGWWDDWFTAFLLRWLPPDAHRLLDVGCGVATAAHALLPALTGATYLGIDADAQRPREARALLAGTSYEARVHLQQARADQLPCGDARVDVVISSMTLQHVLDVPAVLSSVKRVLQAGGRFLAIEPDNLSNDFYFDGPLEEVNVAIRRLFTAQREARRPADIAIGPAVPSLLERAGFTVLGSRPYALGRLTRRPAADVFERARRVVRIASAQGNLAGSAVVQESAGAIDRAAAAAGNRSGYGGQVIPVFVTIAGIS